ncbi:MAG: hypothetical protein PF501_07625 [Salinisphaera sp.]|jgi:hypothetical protein|nr:hypothetical protein [Salinisphaera sp.]
MTGPESIVFKVLTAASRPLLRAEIYSADDRLESQHIVSNALSSLRTENLIERLDDGTWRTCTNQPDDDESEQQTPEPTEKTTDTRSKAQMAIDYVKAHPGLSGHEIRTKLDDQHAPARLTQAAAAGHINREKDEFNTWRYFEADQSNAAAKPIIDPAKAAESQVAARTDRYFEDFEQSEQTAEEIYQLAALFKRPGGPLQNSSARDVRIQLTEADSAIWTSGRITLSGIDATTGMPVQITLAPAAAAQHIKYLDRMADTP